MVNIPTTDRQFQNVPRKLNTLGAFAGELQRPMEMAEKEVNKQQQIKIDTLSTEARMKMDKITQDWRNTNQRNPFDEEGLNNLKNEYQSVLGEYRDQISPMFKNQWDVVASKMSGAYDISNQDWGFKQQRQNAVYDIEQNMANNLAIARRHGRDGNLMGGVADFANSYKQLASYGNGVLGEMDTKKALKNYEKQYMESYITGLAETSPQQAMEALKDPTIVKSLGDDGAEKKMMSIVKKQMAMQDFNEKVERFETERNLTQELDNLSTADALHLLEANEGAVSTKFYKAKQKSLLSAAGITADTRADTALEIMLDITDLDPNNEINYLKGAEDVVTKIEDKYASGELSLNDKKRLTQQVYRGQGKNVDYLKTNDEGWFWDFTYKDANSFVEKNISNPAVSSKVMLQYFRAVDGQEISNAKKKKVLGDIVSTYNRNILSEPRFLNEKEAEKAFNDGKIKKGDTIWVAGKRGKI